MIQIIVPREGRKQVVEAMQEYRRNHPTYTPAMILTPDFEEYSRLSQDVHRLAPWIEQFNTGKRTPKELRRMYEFYSEELDIIEREVRNFSIGTSKFNMLPKTYGPLNYILLSTIDDAKSRISDLIKRGCEAA